MANARTTAKKAEAKRDGAQSLAARFLQHRATRDEPAVVAIRRDVYVGETDEEARRIAGAVIERGYRGFDPDALVYGSPATVAERFRDLAGLGYTDVIIRNLVSDQSEALASLGRMGEVRELVADA